MTCSNGIIRPIAFRIMAILVVVLQISWTEPVLVRPTAGWRGDGTGVYPTAGLVTEWDETNNVLWRTTVGSAYSSPVIAGSRVFVTSEPAKIVCVDLQNGEIQWKDTLKAGDLPAELQENAAANEMERTSCGYAAPTPVSDGKHVFVVFGSGLVGCYTIEGQRQWVRYLEPAGKTFGHSSSPLLIDGKLLVNVHHLVALDAATGKTVWECPDAEHTYGTPVSLKIGGSQVVVTPHGKVVRVSDGSLVAKALAPDLGGSEFGISPVADGDVVYLGDRTFSAVRLSLDGERLVVDKQWSVYLDVTSFASPVVWKGLLFFVGNAAECFVLDLKTGKTVHETELKIGHQGVDDPVLATANLYPSLIVAGGRLLVGNDRGQIFIYEASRELREISRTRLMDGSGATPAIVDSTLILRSGAALLRIGKTK